MRLLRVTVIFLLAICRISPLSAQTEAEETGLVPTSIERIVEESGGNLQIDIPEDILDQILNDFESGRKNQQKESIRPGINRLQGYRIQVFSDGRNQHSLETRAKARGNAIVAKFPKYRGQVYTFSSSPNWYTRIGNFRSEHEAAGALAELKRAFPSFAQEMRVVKSKIVVIK